MPVPRGRPVWRASAPGAAFQAVMAASVGTMVAAAVAGSAAGASAAAMAGVWSPRTTDRSPTASASRTTRPAAKKTPAAMRSGCVGATHSRSVRESPSAVARMARVARTTVTAAGSASAAKAPVSASSKADGPDQPSDASGGGIPSPWRLPPLRAGRDDLRRNPVWGPSSLRKRTVVCAWCRKNGRACDTTVREPNDVAERHLRPAQRRTTARSSGTLLTGLKRSHRG